MDDFAITITWIDYLNYNWHVTAQNDNIKGMKKVARSPDGLNDVVLFYPSPNSLLLSFYEIYLLNCRQIWYWMLYWIITSISQPKIPHKEHERLSACCVSPPPPPNSLLLSHVWNDVIDCRKKRVLNAILYKPYKHHYKQLPRAVGSTLCDFGPFLIKKSDFSDILGVL